MQDGSRFNPRPREGATERWLYRVPTRVSFNPRPREGATFIFESHDFLIFVSIHAPVKGRQRRPGSARRAGYGAHFRERTSRSLQLFFSS